MIRIKIKISLCFFLMASSVWGYQEFQIDSSKVALSAQGTETLKKTSTPMVPRGSAVLTPSGELSQTGIHSIIHVAPGSMTRSDADFAPTKEGLVQSLKNAGIIAQKNNLKCLALPFIGGGIFLDSMGMTKTQLAQLIVGTLSEDSKDLSLTFVTWGEEDSKIFQNVLKERKNPLLKQTQGSITDFKVHQCQTIVNAANMEMIFGGGVSGAIGRATGSPGKINKLARKAILESNKK